jgi:hypothetical protein
MQPWSQPLLWPGSAATGGDPYWSNVVLLMGYEGTDGATSGPGYVDESPAAHGTATTYYDVKISTTRKRFGASSLWLARTTNGTSAISFPTSANWDIGAGQFTIEFFFSINNLDGGSTVQQPVFSGPNRNYEIRFQGLIFTFSATDGGAGAFTLSDAVNVPDGTQWYYCAVDFDGTKYRLYHNMNGASGSQGPAFANANMIASHTGGITISSSATLLEIGSTGLTISLHSADMWVDEVRFTKGVARYATDTSFPVPTAAFPRHA